MKKVCLPCRREFDADYNFCLECGNALGAVETTPDEIINCAFAFRCPLEWDKLEATGTEDVRFCGSCQQNVYFAHSQSQLDNLARNGVCVAFHPSPLMSFNKVPPLMGMIVPSDPPPEKAVSASEDNAPKKARRKFWK